MSWTDDYLELLRAPAVLTVLGDSLAGAAAAKHSMTGRRSIMPLASASLYAAGMALNDFADREIDAVERPERPIPSGRITPSAALGTAAGLTAVGLGLSAIGGGKPALMIGVPLAASIWTYDLAAKRNAVTGTLVMGACRGLDVLMGAGTGRLRAALPAALTMAGHTVAVTALSRGEVNGTSSVVAASAAATTALVSSVVLAGSVVTGTSATSRDSSEKTRKTIARIAATCAALAVYTGQSGRAQWRAAQDPSAHNALGATKAGIRSMIPLQAALTLRHGSPMSAIAIGSVDTAGRLLRSASKIRKISES